MGSQIFGTNWKMRMGYDQAIMYAKVLDEFIRVLHFSPEVFVMPPYTLIRPMAEVLKCSQVMIGAQNFHWATEGEFTGEMSIPLLKEAGAKIALVGHSERRNLFHESLLETRKKLSTAIRHGMRTVLCIGEFPQDHHDIDMENIIRGELELLLADLRQPDFAQLMIAYEPRWAIGVNGVVASTREIEEAISAIRSNLERLTAEFVPVLYGGSVNENNCERIIGETSVDGLFIGRAALDPNSFISLIKRAMNGRS